MIYDTPKMIKYSYFRSTDTLHTQWRFPLHTSRRCFPLQLENLYPIRMDHVTLGWAADRRCECARESVCPRSCSNGSKVQAQFSWAWKKFYNLETWSYLNICLAITALSTTFPDVGSVTGSSIIVLVIGSRNSSGASASSSSSSWAATPIAYVKNR